MNDKIRFLINTFIFLLLILNIYSNFFYKKKKKFDIDIKNSFNEHHTVIYYYDYNIIELLEYILSELKFYENKIVININFNNSQYFNLLSAIYKNDEEIKNEVIEKIAYWLEIYNERDSFVKYKINIIWLKDYNGSWILKKKSFEKQIKKNTRINFKEKIKKWLIKKLI